MTLTFGFVTAVTVAPGAAGRTRTTPETITERRAGRSTTTWVTTPTAGTRRDSGARRPATLTTTKPPSRATTCARSRGERTAAAAPTRGRAAPSRPARSTGPRILRTHRTLQRH